MKDTVRSIAESRYSLSICLLAAFSFLGYYTFSNEWIDTSLLMSRIVFVFVILASIRKFPLTWVLPFSIFLGPVLDRTLEYLESSLMEIVRLVHSNAVNPQFIIIALAILLLAYILCRLAWTRSLRFLFLSVLLLANIGASSLFHYTQVDQFIDLEDQRMMKQANLLYSNLKRSGFQHIDDICSLHGLSCIYGTSRTPVDGIDKDFYPMFKQAVDAKEPSYRTMRKFDAEEADPAKASMYQIFMFSHHEKWFYFNDQDIISPYYFNARRNFSLLYSAFSSVWLLIAAYILYRHSSFIDRKFSFIKKKN